MKAKFFTFTTIIILSFASLNYAQSKKFSAGVISTYFSNIGNSGKLTQLDHPTGYGLILGYRLTNRALLVATGEYFHGSMENLPGNERDYRFHLSLYYAPLSFDGIRPYISAGLVYTNSNYKYYNGTSDNDNHFNGRFGAGLDYPLISGINLNADLGLYTDGLNFVGISSSLGLRYAF